LSSNTDASIQRHVADPLPTRKVRAIGGEGVPSRNPNGTAQGKRRKMERHTHSTYIMGVLHADGDDDTVEVRILRPHETYRRTRGACSQDIADDSPTDVQEALR
jgi:hypothetical protein